MKPQDHPRVCGKDFAVSSIIMGRSGSPPRMRERLEADKAEKAAWRITPAYAGKTHREMRTVVNMEDHPRVCGKDGNF